jgi:hypothetical protein
MTCSIQNESDVTNFPMKINFFLKTQIIRNLVIKGSMSCFLRSALDFKYNNANVWETNGKN